MSETARLDRPRSIGRRITGTLAALCLAVTALLATGSAATADVTAQANVCGSSFALIDSYYGSGNGHTAVLRLYYSSTYKQNCAVMVKTNQTDHKDQVGVQIRPSGGTVDSENDWFYSYAGPVYTPSSVNMSGKCVDVHGFVGGAFEIFFQIEERGVHCG
ncbi:hypothetical protein [Glycomyces sp. YM15]|uniref:hypothetical protein n=1 Tax=Glycomyces sp. YM15 TaxID=2800446 RepID=UPI00196244F7|nr:hypothetical protein [Glycomyces sp. YM15]